jgi:Regulator of ribonuclease activity B
MFRRLSGKSNQQQYHPGDLEVIENLRKCGADLRVPRDTVHYLYFPTQAGAEAAGAQVRALGLNIEVQAAATGDNWLTKANHDMIVNADTITAERATLEAICATYRGEYDGWEAAVTN